MSDTVTRRQYVAAYRSANGNVIPISESTCWLEGAERDADRLRSIEDQAEVFVAYRDLPEWEQITNDLATKLAEEQK